MTRALLWVFVASLGIDWPALPGNARLAEVLFVPAAIAVALTGGGLRFHFLDAAVIAYVAAGSISVIASSDRTASLIELARHGYLALIYLVIALAVVRGLGRTVAIGLASMGAILALAGVLFAVLFAIRPVAIPEAGSVMTLPYAGEILRLRALTASPTMLACVLTASMPFALYAAIDAAIPRMRTIWAIATAVMILALALTFSHAWAGAALALTISAWPSMKRYRLVRASSVGVVIGLTLVFNASLVASVRSVSIGSKALADPTPYPYGVDVGTAEIGAFRVDYAVMSYFRIKQLAVEAFVDRPLTGIGLDRFFDVTQAAYRDGRLPHGYREIDPHSALLGRFAETGLIGGLTLIVLWVLVLLTAGPLLASVGAESSLARAAVAGFAGLLLAGINIDVMNLRFLWVGVGLLRGLTHAQR